MLDIEHHLPRRSSLAIILLFNALIQITLFIIVSSSSAYAKHLGGSSTFSGLVIGVPLSISGVALIPLMKYDQGKYGRPLHVCCGFMVLGHVLYGLAYHANFLYLILLGRMVQGVGFAFSMYTKRYCSDTRIVGIRRRTTLAGYLVLGQGIGMSAGPFFGGLLYKVGFKNSVFNGYSAPGWIMAGVWIAFWIAATILFEDVPDSPRHEAIELPSINIMIPAADLSKQPKEYSSRPDPPPLQSPTSSTSPPPPPFELEPFRTTPQQRGVIFCMCWFAMSCFFILGAWEANIPVYGSSMLSSLHWSPYAAGNFLALGGAATIPFLLLNLFAARRTQDRSILALGTGLGLAGLILALILFRGHMVKVHYAGLFICWFLVALGFNLATTCTLSLLSKQLPPSWNARSSLAIQYSNFTGRVAGSVWGGSGVHVGMRNYIGLEVALIGIGGLLFTTLWRELKAKTG
ncbi:MFS general substrate transporter [Rickenella mellea]|uniref:MFS general substrate transporter n=1 Tax=Rickenella mellea TaxID=50990 RepID=A0A4Y7Q7F2_9AGAM|nr:MFS general substrate transporter [Rickenella mellea]